MCELLWSDPQPMYGRSPSKRGVGCQFGPDVTRRFLENNCLEYIIRSHEVKDNGYEVTHDGKCITVFSAPNYCDTMGNKGAFITLKGNDMTPNYTTYEGENICWIRKYWVVKSITKILVAYSTRTVKLEIRGITECQQFLSWT
jgi:hypothetical protein